MKLTALGFRRCARFHTLLVDGLPRFAPATRSAAYRLVALVDAAYDAKTRLVCSAAAAKPEALFERILPRAAFDAALAAASPAEAELLVSDDTLAFVKERTSSRLTEMQSVEWARAHAEARAPELLASLPPDDKHVV